MAQTDMVSKTAAVGVPPTAVTKTVNLVIHGADRAGINGLAARAAGKIAAAMAGIGFAATLPVGEIAVVIVIMNGGVGRERKTEDPLFTPSGSMNKLSRQW